MSSEANRKRRKKMATTWLRSKALFLVGLTLLIVLVVSCASGETAPAGGASPAPAAAPAPAPGVTVPAAPVAAPAPAAAPAAAPQLAPATSAAPTAPAPTSPGGLSFAGVFSTTSWPGGPQIDAARLAKEKGVQELLKFHANLLPLWTKAKYGGEAVHVTTSVRVTQNPLTIGARRNRDFGKLLYYDQGLCSWVGRDGDFSRCNGQYAINEAVVIVPGIFQSWQQPNPLTYIFTIRRGVLWPAIPPMLRPDREVTAEDVKWFIDIQKEKGVYKDSFVDVTTTVAADRYTLKVTTAAPLPDFLRNIGQSGIGIIPRECYEEGPACLDNKLLTPGPWLIKDFVLRQKMVYERNPEFFLRGLPYVDRWTLLQIIDPASQKAAYITGQVMNYRSYDPVEAQTVARQVPGSKTHLQYSAASTFSLRPKLEGPLADIRVRRALMLATDVRAIWELCCAGNGVIPSEMGRDLYAFGKSFYFTLDLAGTWYQYDPERAKKLMAEAGYSNGFKTTITTSSISGGPYETILGVQSFWKKNLNVEAAIKAVDSSTSGILLRERKWDGLIFGGGPGSWTDGITGFLPVLKGSPFNYQNVDDPLVTELFEKSRRELDPVKRATLLWQFEQRDMDQLYTFRYNHHFPYDLMQPWEMNGASHAWEFYYSLGVVWLTMIDPDKVKR